MVSLKSRLKWAEKQVDACAPIALKYFHSSTLKVSRKRDGSPVTAADKVIERRLRQAIERAYPKDGILGEEYGRCGTQDAYWTIDPIDGTRAFTCGLPTWSILLSYVEHGRPLIGICDFPALGTRLVAARGIGAFERTGRRTVRLPMAKPPVVLRDAVILHGGSRWWQGTRYTKGFAKLVKNCYLERAYGDAYGYLWVVWGMADAVLDYGVHPWDVAPLAAIAQATGRVLTDCEGRLSFTSSGSIFAHPRFAKTVSQVLRGAR